ncbi:MAG: hypothetical protein PHE29_13950 [Tissierellia bacterium]|nr:hypothetical protein [Tissierellia bacterium]MDD4779039.1 hypothetical protein [Tissierellia bacterium]
MKQGYEKRFNQGDIVYWCHQNGHEYSVKMGMVDEQFSDAVCIDYLSLKENRKINGIPINEFKSEEKYKKLPKGWSYNTQLFEITYDEIKDCVGAISSPECIKLAYKNGLLVKDSIKFHGVIETEITKDGYRIIKKYPLWVHHISNVSIRPDKVYFTYDEAKKEVDENIAEFYRQANLSDYEWSLEQINKTIDMYIKINGKTDTIKNEYKNWFINMKNIEDIEIRIYGTEIQWKYWKNKKWNNIEL